MNQALFRRLISAASVFAAIPVLTLSGCGALPHPQAVSEPVGRTDFLLNTFVDIKLYDSNDTNILDDAIAICKDFETQFSRTDASGEVYRLNHRQDGETEIELSEETAELIGLALSFCEQSEGAFDITIEPVSSLWDFTSGEAALPDPDALRAAVETVGYEKLELENGILTFRSPDTSLDLGSIAKGYIADRLKEYLVECGVESAIINLGGNVLCIGEKPDGSAFRIGLQKPFAETSETFATLDVRDMSVVTSGVYERNFLLDGKNYHHILDPSTGYPYDNGLISVTILSESSADGDGLSTACFSMGLEKGMELIDSLDGVYACFIDDDYQIYYSEGMEAFVRN